MKTNKYTIVNEICSMYLDKQCSIALVAEKLAISSHKVRYWLEKRGISRRDRSKAAYLANSQRFNKHSCSIRKNLSAKEKELLIAGIMLYWAEGWKKNSNYISFTNSEPKMIKLFLDFLRKICNVQEGRLRLSLHLYDDQNESALRKYWSSITKIPLGQFHSTHIHKGKTGSYKKKSKYGTASIKYGDKKLLQQILEKINDF